MTLRADDPDAYGPTDTGYESPHHYGECPLCEQPVATLASHLTNCPNR